MCSLISIYCFGTTKETWCCCVTRLAIASEIELVNVLSTGRKLRENNCFQIYVNPLGYGLIGLQEILTTVILKNRLLVLSSR
jgi:hypothetical protein